jgi:hypothetical protein
MIGNCGGGGTWEFYLLEDDCGTKFMRGGLLIYCWVNQSLQDLILM